MNGKTAAKCLLCKGSGKFDLVTNDELRKIIAAGKGELTLKEYAKRLGVSFQFLGKVIDGIYKPGPTIAKALGYEQVAPEIYYRKVPDKKLAKRSNMPSKRTIKKALRAIRKRLPKKK